MKNGRGAIGSILFIGFCVVVLSVYDKSYSNEHLTPWLSSSPLYYLKKAQIELDRDHMYNTKENLNSAIYCMESIGYYTSGEAKVYLEASVEDLYDLIERLENDKVSATQTQNVYFKVLSSIAFAEFIICEQEFKNGQYNNSLELMKVISSMLKESHANVGGVSSSIKTYEKEVSAQVSIMASSLIQSKKMDSTKCEQIKRTFIALLEEPI